MPELWRLFVAVPLPDTLRADLAEQVAALHADAPDGIRWVDPESWHLTLAFLGDMDPARVPALTAALREAVAPIPAFTASIRGIGAFPRPSSARVIWLGVDGGEALRRLANAVADACGVERDGPFRGHITIGRLREDTGIKKWLASASVSDADLSSTALRLERSALGPDHASYITLATMVLR